jgi:uncharacterized protein YjiS (DUF1127 family)
MPALHKTQIITTQSHTTGLQAVLRAVQAWATRHRSRQSLARLDDHMLRDIGLDRTDARQECAKAFWQD